MNRNGAYLILLLVVCTTALLLSQFHFTKHEQISIRNCLGTPASAVRCNQKFYETYAKTYGAKEELARFTRDEKEDSQLNAGCHSVLHKIGHVAAQEYGSLGNAFDAGSTICSNGFYHGVVEQLFGTMDFAALTQNEISGICNNIVSTTSQPSLKLNCIHGVGHALMFMSGGDTANSLLGCGSFTRDEDRSSCVTGVIMEEGFRIEASATTARFNDDPTMFCSQVPGVQTSCWLAQSAKIIAHLQGTSSAEVFCSSIQSGDARTHCHAVVLGASL